MKNRPFLILALIVLLPFIFFGAFLWGRSTSPHTEIDLVWNEIPGAVTVGWSVDESDVIVVYFSGQLIKELREEDGEEFERIKAFYDEIAQ